MTMTEPYDVIVIGAGPGGYSAAILAAKKGLRVGIAEGSALGGTCTNTGCIPTKTYIESVNLLLKIREAAKFGIEVGKPSLDFARMKSRKDKIVKRLGKGVEYLLKHQGVELFPGPASIPNPGSVLVGDTLLSARHTVVATGARPRRLAVLEACDHWTSDDIFEVTEVPETLAVIGGGVIGMEMAHIFNGLGTKVTVVEALSRILPQESRHVSEYMAKIYHKVDIRTSSTVAGVEGSGPYRLAVDTPSGREDFEVQKILVCIGRQPVLPPGLAELGVALTPGGGILVDGFMRSSIDGIYAVGDVTGGHMYAYVASREAIVAVEHMTGGTTEMSYRNIPSIIFTSPEVASVGSIPDSHDLTESRVGTFPVSALGRARTLEANEGYAHVISSRQEGLLEKISIIGPHATELIAWATLAIDQGLTVSEFLECFYPHPVLAEMVKEAAEDIIDRSVHHP